MHPHTASRLSKPSSRVTPRSILRCERQAPPSRPTRMSDKPGVPQPSKSKPTPAVPQPIAQPRAPTLNGGRGAPAPNGVGRGGARDGRGDTFAGRGCVRSRAPRGPRCRLARGDSDRQTIDGGRPRLPPFSHCLRAGARPAPGRLPNPSPSRLTRILPSPYSLRRGAPGTHGAHSERGPGTNPPPPRATCQVKNPPRSRKPRRGAPFRAAPSERSRVRPSRPRANA